MSNPDARAAVDAAVALSRTHGHAPPADVLELVMLGRTGQLLDFADPAAELQSLASPRSDFGQLVAAALDRGMEPEDWRGLTGPHADPAIRTALLEIWRDEVMPKMADRFGVTITGLP
jgi:hypothetical protein